MNHWITSLLQEYGIAPAYLDIFAVILGLFFLLFVAFCGFYLIKHRIIEVIQTVVQKSKNQFDDALVNFKVFDQLALLVPLFIILIGNPYFIAEAPLLSNFITVIAKVAITFQIARTCSALLNVLKHAYRVKAQERYLPLNASIQLIKLAIYLVATILSVALIIDRSPIYLLSGLGALTAVLLLVFQDTIKGLVASIQIAANKMVAPGDWVELPQYGADGDVLEIGLNTVKIQNFDRTVTTVPTYALISGSFKNWRDMFNSGGRRIKRAINIDIASIHFYEPADIEHLKSIKHLGGYLAEKLDEISAHGQAIGAEPSDKLNHRQLTNIGTFRAYIEAYLKQHDKVHQDMTCMVRQLAPTEAGVPLELYFFSNDQNWVNYEVIQADIFDHLYAMAPEFGLRIFQHPTGYDWQQR